MTPEEIVAKRLEVIALRTEMQARLRLDPNDEEALSMLEQCAMQLDALDHG